MNMASDFYTNVLEYKGKLLIRGVANGQSYLSRINFEPTLFVPTKEIIVYESNITIRSGSFKYNSSSKSAASSSGTSVTLFYQSGSNGPSGSHTGSGYLTGSHIYLSASLNHPAPSGFYAVPNTNNVLHAFKGSTTQDVGGSSVSNGIEHQVPRFVSRSIGPF